MLYKYRTLDNFKNFVDIILNKRLYAAYYKDLNDPMEGQYLYSINSNQSMIEAIRGEKKKTRIVSLSRKSDIQLMWSHYSDGHRGVVVGVEVDTHKYDLKAIQYSQDPFNLDENDLNSPNTNAKYILSQKHKVWSYEEEERVFIDDGSKFVPVKVVEVIAGSKMSNQDYGFLADLIKKIDSEIVLRRMENGTWNKYFE